MAKKSTSSKGPLVGISSEEAQKFLEQFCELRNKAPQPQGKIVSVDGLDKKTKSVEVLFVNGATWDEEPTTVSGTDLENLFLIGS